MIITSGIFFAAALATVFFQSRGDFTSDEVGWSLTGFLTLIALFLFLRGIFSPKRMHDESHHSLP